MLLETMPVSPACLQEYMVVWATQFMFILSYCVASLSGHEYGPNTALDVFCA